MTPAIIMAADAGPALDGAVALAGRVRRAGATAYGIGGGAALAAESAYALPGHGCLGWLAPIGLIIGGQLRPRGGPPPRHDLQPRGP